MGRAIVITGASSGIGRALARRYAGAGVTLGLVGRDAARLDAVAAECRARGAEVETVCVDIRQREELQAWLDGFDRAHPIDLLIANAGIMLGTPPGSVIEPPETARLVMETNVFGTMNTVQPVLERMLARGRGQIAIVSSLAGFLPLPAAPSYGGSKAALRSYGLALRGACAGTGVRVNVVCPGYVTTPLGERARGLKLFEISADGAARSIDVGLRLNLPVIGTPVVMAILTAIGSIFPEPLRRWLTRPFLFTVANGE